VKIISTCTYSTDLNQRPLKISIFRDYPFIYLGEFRRNICRDSDSHQWRSEWKLGSLHNIIKRFLKSTSNYIIQCPAIIIYLRIDFFLVFSFYELHFFLSFDHFHLMWFPLYILCSPRSCSKKIKNLNSWKMFNYQKLSKQCMY
jgi:hypothetical protein